MYWSTLFGYFRSLQIGDGIKSVDLYYGLTLREEDEIRRESGNHYKFRELEIHALLR